MYKGNIMIIFGGSGDDKEILAGGIKLFIRYGNWRIETSIVIVW